MSDAGPREFWAMESKLDKGPPVIVSNERAEKYAAKDINWSYFKLIEKSAYDALSARVRELESYADKFHCEAVEDNKKIAELEAELKQKNCPDHGLDLSVGTSGPSQKWEALFKLKQDDWIESCKEIDQLQSRLAECYKANEASLASEKWLREKLAAAEADLRKAEEAADLERSHAIKMDKEAAASRGQNAELLQWCERFRAAIDYIRGWTEQQPGMAKAKADEIYAEFEAWKKERGG